MSDQTPDSPPDSGRLIIDTDSSDMGQDIPIVTRSQTKNADVDEDEREPLPPTPIPDAAERVCSSLTFLPLS